MRRGRRVGPWLALALMAFACGPSPSDVEADREAIRDTLESFLPLLAEAYATGNLEPLEPWAAEKEISRIRKRIEDMAMQGRTLVPKFGQLTVEEVDVWNYSNAVVTTFETWDLAVYATGSQQVLSEALAQPNRVKYQLKRDQQRWRILFRTIQE